MALLSVDVAVPEDQLSEWLAGGAVVRLCKFQAQMADRPPGGEPAGGPATDRRTRGKSLCSGVPSLASKARQSLSVFSQLLLIRSLRLN